MIFTDQIEFTDYVKKSDHTLIGVTSGVFDMLHPLHVEYLEKCSKQCQELYVFIDSDRLAFMSKGRYPVYGQYDRAFMVDKLKGIKGVLIIEDLAMMSDCIRIIGDKENTLVSVFKHSTKIYGTSLITYGNSKNNIENVIVPDSNKFRSTTEIRQFFTH